jgi:hypothetical protein
MGLSQEQVYHWALVVQQIFGSLGAWQMMDLALYSLGILLGRQSAASRVAEKLPMMGKADTVQRRLERWLTNPRVVVQACCIAWTRWVFAHGWQTGQPIILLVDETKLGKRLSVMVVGVAYRGCCIPLAWRSYSPKAWPMGQVDLIAELLCWVAAGLPVAAVPLVEADRGIGTSAALIERVTQLGWHYLFRVQGTTTIMTVRGKTLPLRALVKPGEYWSGIGNVFKKYGPIVTRVEVIWEWGYTDPWCLVTNAPQPSGWLYSLRYWQEASFRDLKSDGWQWQRSQVTSPAHADRLILAMTLAYALTLGLGTQTLIDPALRSLVTKGARQTYSIFRLGLRVWERLVGSVVDWAAQFVFIWPDMPTLLTATTRRLRRVHDPAQLPLPFWSVLCVLFGPSILKSVGI